MPAGKFIMSALKKMSSEKIIRLGEWFVPTVGNTIWSITTKHGIGASKFFTLSEEVVRDWGLPQDCLAKAITSARFVETFTFMRGDWERLRSEGRRVYMFMCHKPKSQLPKAVQDYINWGEAECRVRSGVACSETTVCKKRAETRELHGWYDLGGFIPTPIMAIRYPKYHPQFFLVDTPLATYHGIITLIPKVRIRFYNWVFDPSEYEGIISEVNNNVELDEVEVRALLAYLNSSLVWYLLEQNSRRTGDGALVLDINTLKGLPLLNVKAINEGRVEELARLFDELEEKARRLASS